MEDELGDWRKRCEKAEGTLNTLKNLSVTAVRDYDDLQRRYDANQKQYDELKNRLEDTQNELRRVEAVLPNALAEYERVQHEVEIQKYCREEAEKYASQVHKNNNKLTVQTSKLKRQSAMLLDKLQMSTVEINIETLQEMSEMGDTDPRESTLDTESVVDLRDNLNAVIDDLKEQLLDKETQLKLSDDQRIKAIENERLATSKFQDQHALLEQTQKSLKEYERALTKFQEVSSLAVTEHEEMQNQLEMEQLLKLQAEKYAHEMLTQSKAAQRQSKAMMGNIGGEQQLMKALLDIEDLTKSLESDRLEHENKVTLLEGIIEHSKDTSALESLEDRLNLQQKQLEDQRKSYSELEKWKVKLENENKKLIDELDVANQKLKGPPPPPPPPPPPLPIFKPFHKLLGKKKKVPTATLR